jgi:hypothetical protein
MTVAERARYAVRIALGSLRRGTWWAYGDGDAGRRVQDPRGLATRLRQTPGALRAAWRAAGEA